MSEREPTANPPSRPGTATLFETLYSELREIARLQLRRERAGHSLQPTALVNEAYLKLAQSPPSGWQGRTQMLGYAARAMRQILVDHARARSAGKRGGGWRAVTLDEGLIGTGKGAIDVLALDRALETLAAKDERCARVAELRLFAGATAKEIADNLGVSTRTAESEWAFARMWLSRELAG